MSSVWDEIFGASLKTTPIQILPKLRIRRFREGAVMPTRGTHLAAALDVYACAMGFMSENHTEQSLGYLTIAPGESKSVPTGLNLRIPQEYAVLVLSRSGLAAKNQVTVLNAPGLLDADYDGDGPNYELTVLLHNQGTKDFQVNHGDRIAQIMFYKLPEFQIVEDFEDNQNRLASNRDGGFGSTGVK